MTAARVRVGVLGAAGRMGHRLIEALQTHPQLQLGAAIVRPGSDWAGQDAGKLLGVGALGVEVTDHLAAVMDAVDVVVDVTTGDDLAGHLDICAHASTPLVIGTTGLDASRLQLIDRCAQRLPIVHAPNFSAGVVVALRLLALAAQALGEDADVEITEAHHAHKIDAPSGTALRMGEVIAAALGQDLEEVAEYGRHGAAGPRYHRAIGFHSVRAADIVGEHEVLFAMPGERLEIVHRATDRLVFARGALRAAGWLQSHGRPGLYGMEDVLGMAAASR